MKNCVKDWFLFLLLLSPIIIVTFIKPNLYFDNIPIGVAYINKLDEFSDIFNTCSCGFVYGFGEYLKPHVSNLVIYIIIFGLLYTIQLFFKFVLMKIKHKDDRIKDNPKHIMSIIINIAIKSLIVYLFLTFLLGAIAYSKICVCGGNTLIDLGP